MPIVNKVKTAVLTTTLTTPLLTAGASETIRITHILASCSATGGTISLSILDDSSSVAARIVNAKTITANSTLELFDLFLESNDVLRGGYATATDAEIVICYQVET